MQDPIKADLMRAKTAAKAASTAASTAPGASPGLRGDFVHLHLHSAYSLSEGAIKIGKLKDLCLADRMPAVAVTDTNNLFGALEASETLSAAGIQPIPGLQLSVEIGALAGVEARSNRAPSLVLLAQNEAGFNNLMRLSSRAFLNSVSRGGAARRARLARRCECGPLVPLGRV